MYKNAWFARFARVQNISADALREAVKRAEKGQIDADLGGGLIKQRVARSGQGKSRGCRTLIMYCEGEIAFFVYGFAKSDRNNIRKDEEVQFKKMARYLLALSDQQLDGLIAMGKLEEIESDDKKISK